MEAIVKSMKFHLGRVIGEARLFFTKVYTLLTQIEAVLNSRPLSPVSNDLNDTIFLTFGHSVIGRKLTSPAERDLLEIEDNRLSKFQPSKNGQALLEELVQRICARTLKTVKVEEERWISHTC